MTKEEDVFEKVNRIRIDFFDSKYKDVHTDDELEEKYEALGDILNMLKEKDKEIEHWKNGFERELEDNRKNTCELLKQDLIIREKDKQIDLSAEFIKNNMSEKKIINEICIKGKCNNAECYEDDLKECIKLHFVKLAKEKGE